MHMGICTWTWTWTLAWAHAPVACGLGGAAVGKLIFGLDFLMYSLDFIVYKLVHVDQHHQENSSVEVLLCVGTYDGT